MICKKCGKPINKKAAFCPYCGMPVEKQDRVTTVDNPEDPAPHKPTNKKLLCVIIAAGIVLILIAAVIAAVAVIGYKNYQTTAFSAEKAANESPLANATDSAQEVTEADSQAAPQLPLWKRAYVTYFEDRFDEERLSRMKVSFLDFDESGIPAVFYRYDTEESLCCGVINYSPQNGKAYSLYKSSFRNAAQDNREYKYKTCSVQYVPKSAVLYVNALSNDITLQEHNGTSFTSLIDEYNILNPTTDNGLYNGYESAVRFLSEYDPEKDEITYTVSDNLYGSRFYGSQPESEKAFQTCKQQYETVKNKVELLSNPEALDYPDFAAALTKIDSAPEGGSEAEASLSDGPRWMTAYKKRFEAIKTTDPKAVTLLYIDDDDIPECVLWTDPYMDVFTHEIFGYTDACILSYKDGELFEFHGNASGVNTEFSFKERSGQFSLEEVLGLRSATWWELVTLQDGFEKTGTAWTDNDQAKQEVYYQVNDKDVNRTQLDRYLASFRLETVLTESDWHSSMADAYQALKLGKPDKRPEYIFPDSDIRYLSRQDLAGMSKEQLRLARNEIYARHGYIFKQEDIKQYFESKSWYHGKVPKVTDDMLNRYEIANRDLIISMEKE